jgi:hypothetical protein
LEGISRRARLVKLELEFGLEKKIEKRKKEFRKIGECRPREIDRYSNRERERRVEKEGERIESFISKTKQMGLHHWQCRDSGAQYKKKTIFRHRRATLTSVYVVVW